MEREELIKQIQEILKSDNTFEDWTDAELKKFYVVLKVRGVEVK